MTPKDLKDRFELLFSDLEALLFEAKAIEERKIGLDQQERDLRAFEERLLEKKDDVDRIRIEQQKEREYIAAANLELSTREKELASKKERADVIDLKMRELEEKRLLILAESDKVKKEKENLSLMREDVAEVTRKMALYQKELAVNRERKRLLDLREERIAAKEKRLQINESYLDE